MAGPITIGRRGIPRPRLQLRWRRDAARLTAGQLARLRAAWAESYTLPDERGFAYHAGLHGAPPPIECPHGGELFLPWHRAYLYFFEMSLRDLEPSVTLPWWDWSTGALPAPYTDPDAANPLRSGPISPNARGPDGRDRTFRTGPRTLPSARDIERALRRDDFLDFTAAVEDLHNRVHGSIGGSMGSVPRAAFDPIFWAHHSFVDRLWRLWQLRHQSVTLRPGFLGRALAPFPMTVRQTLSVTALGYDYARSTVSIDSGGVA